MAYEFTFTPRFQKHFTWFYEGDKMIILVDVRHHDILKQF